jgi:hypothetical protein
MNERLLVAVARVKAAVPVLDMADLPDPLDPQPLPFEIAL